MKRYVYAIVLSAFGLLPSLMLAQKVRIGFSVGPNVTFALYDNDFPGPDTIGEPGHPDIITRSTKPGFSFSAGGVIDFDITDKLFFTSGLNLSGTRHHTTSTVNYEDASYDKDTNQYFHVLALQIPVSLHYRLKKFTAGGGFYGAWAFSGKNDFQISINDSLTNSGKRNLVFTTVETKPADFKSFDAGFRIETGYGIKRWRITAHYDFGLVNISPKTPFSIYSPQKYAMKKHTLGLSFIYQPWPR